jgi:small subunit ribosomal protein S16
MLKIRLARHGRKKLPFYRIVLTEHTKPSQSWYKLVLWRFNPLSHTMEANVPEIKDWISKWAQPTERVAKLLFADTKDWFFKNYFVERESTKWKEIEAKKKAEADAKIQEAKEKAEAAKALQAAAEAAERSKQTENVIEEVAWDIKEETVEEPKSE